MMNAANKTVHKAEKRDYRLTVQWAGRSFQEYVSSRLALGMSQTKGMGEK